MVIAPCADVIFRIKRVLHYTAMIVNELLIEKRKGNGQDGEGNIIFQKNAIIAAQWLNEQKNLNTGLATVRNANEYN